VVGVNVHVGGAEPEPELLRVSAEVEREQKARLAALRASRPSAPVREALDRLQQGAAGSENLMGLMLGAVEARCTVGEVADALRQVFGVHQERLVI